jgi:hypothetical protein
MHTEIYKDFEIIVETQADLAFGQQARISGMSVRDKLRPGADRFVLGGQVVIYFETELIAIEAAVKHCRNWVDKIRGAY